MGIWWALWIASNILGQMSFRASSAAKGIEGLQHATIAEMVYLAVRIPLFFVAIALIVRISNALERHFARLQAQPAVADIAH